MKLTRGTSISLIILAVIFFYSYYTTPPMPTYEGEPPKIKVVPFFKALLTDNSCGIDSGMITEDKRAVIVELKVIRVRIWDESR